MLPCKKLYVGLLVAALVSGCARGGDKETADKANDAPAQQSKAYQATYSAPDNFAYQTEHFYFDGAGHYRIDISGQGPAVTHVLDEGTDTTTMWAEGTDQYVRRQSEPTDPLVMWLHMRNLPKSPQVESLGERIVRGHKCHGWRGTDTEVWFDDDYGCPVLATSGGITSTLTEFSTTIPDASLFQPPPGYTSVSKRTTTRSQHDDSSRIFSDIERHIH